jgi:hypothetical protein
MLEHIVYGFYHTSMMLKASSKKVMIDTRPCTTSPKTTKLMLSQMDTVPSMAPTYLEGK